MHVYILNVVNTVLGDHTPLLLYVLVPDHCF